MKSGLIDVDIIHVSFNRGETLGSIFMLLMLNLQRNMQAICGRGSFFFWQIINDKAAAIIAVTKDIIREEIKIGEEGD